MQKSRETLNQMLSRNRTAELSDPNKSEIRFWKFAASETWDHVQQVCGFGSEPKSQKHLFLVQLKPESEPYSQPPVILVDFDQIQSDPVSGQDPTSPR